MGQVLACANPPKIIRVVRAADVWTVTAEGQGRGRFDFKVDAEEAALRLAKAAAAAGVRVQIFVEEALGVLTPIRV